jgi:hypothetical protein
MPTPTITHHLIIRTHHPSEINSFVAAAAHRFVAAVPLSPVPAENCCKVTFERGFHVETT